MAFTILHTRLADRGTALSADCLRVADGRIVAIGGPEIAQPGDVLVDGTGATLLPGLIDSHVHLAPGSTQLAATYGVTTQLDMFSMPEVIAGETPRSAFFTSSIGATAPGGHPTMAFPPFPYVTGPEDAKQFVAGRIAEGADHLKLIYDDGSGAMMNIPTLTSSTVRALADEAHAHGLTVVAHVSTAAGAVAVVECGVDVLAHVPSDLMSPADLDAVAGVAVIATLGVGVDGFNGPSGHLPLLDEPELMSRMPARWRRVLDHQSRRWMPPHPPDGAAARANTLALLRAGVRVLAGTDAPNPGQVFGASLHRELVHLVAAGLSPAQAVVAAASAPAEVFQLTDRGRLAVGARADLLLVDGDPLADITATQRIRQTWVGGDAPVDYAGTDGELAGIRFLGETTSRIIKALKEQWPGFPAPEDVVREDGEVLGRVVPGAGGWLPTTVFGAALGPAGEKATAVQTVESEGLACLTETWWARTDADWQEAVLMEAQPERVRLRWKDPLLEQPPSGRWLDLTDVDLSRQPRPT
ncbi:amidohydrolase family protein [Kribbella sp. NPDC048928]|uniref:amidohydrolase family protein n=1 Tax=Kribbella sp. NPDC048928 TaxID=3364111 RepID=UPI003710D336